VTASILRFPCGAGSFHAPWSDAQAGAPAVNIHRGYGATSSESVPARNSFIFARSRTSAHSFQILRTVRQLRGSATRLWPADRPIGGQVSRHPRAFVTFRESLAVATGQWRRVMFRRHEFTIRREQGENGHLCKTSNTNAGLLRIALNLLRNFWGKAALALPSGIEPLSPP
jgi:hypothetical protein